MVIGMAIVAARKQEVIILLINYYYKNTDVTTGKDDRSVKSKVNEIPKTIGSECNDGVRFDVGPYGVSYILDGLAQEVVRRMVDVGIIGGLHVLLKVKERKPNSGPPGKFNGTGPCFNRSKGCNIAGFLQKNNLTMKDKISRDSSVISRMALKVFEEMSIDKKEVCGMGIVISKLEGKLQQN